jgi:hypothetical protein
MLVILMEQLLAVSVELSKVVTSAVEVLILLQMSVLKDAVTVTILLAHLLAMMETELMATDALWIALKKTDGQLTEYSQAPQLKPFLRIATVSTTDILTVTADPEVALGALTVLLMLVMYANLLMIQLTDLHVLNIAETATTTLKEPFVMMETTETEMVALQLVLLKLDLNAISQLLQLLMTAMKFVEINLIMEDTLVTMATM